MDTSSFKLHKSFTLEPFWTFLFRTFCLSVKSLIFLLKCTQTTSHHLHCGCPGSHIVSPMIHSSGLLMRLPLPSLAPFHPLPSTAGRSIVTTGISESPNFGIVSSSHSSGPWQWPVRPHKFCAVRSRSVVSDSFRPHGLYPCRLLSPWGFSRQEYWCRLPCLLREIFPTQGWISGLPHCRRILYRLSHQGSNTSSSPW